MKQNPAYIILKTLIVDFLFLNCNGHEAFSYRSVLVNLYTYIPDVVQEEQNQERFHE